MNTTAYGRLVRKARLDNDITMLDMARSIGVLPSALCATETGEKEVTPDLLEKVERFFGSRGIVVKGLREAAQKQTNP